MFKFASEDIEKYKNINPSWGQVGAVTYKRTYARPVYKNEEIVNTESWLDTCVRVIEGNMNLIPNDPTATKEWALEALDLMYKMAWLPPGRGLWMMGTEYATKRGGDALNNCFRKGTLVHTQEGIFPIEELAGKTINILSQDGIYRKARFKSYGEQPLLKVVLSNTDEIYATPEHQWIVWDEKKGIPRENRIFTKDLKTSHKIPLIFEEGRIIPDERAIAHGFVYGDGTINTYSVKEGTKSYGLVRFPNKVKQDAIFDTICKYGTNKSDWQVPAIIHLPVEWKSVPEFTTREYALGFIIGLITADGYVRDSISIHQADKESLEQIRKLAMWAGLKTCPVRMDREISPYTGEYSPMYVFTISTATLPKELLIRQDQKDKWKCKRGAVQKTTRVRGIEATGLTEEVYCCTEMETHTMVIESGVLTGQCWYVDVRPQSYEDMEMFKDTYQFSNPTDPMPSFPFVFMFDRAMLGGGVGFGANKNNIKQYPKVQSRVNLKILLDENHPDWERIQLSEEWERIQDNIVINPSYKDLYNSIVIGDTREGWGIAVRELIDSHWCATEQGHEIPLLIDMSNIRGYGVPIKGFGGTASGPLPLIDALVYINNILNSRVGKNLKSIDTVDMMNILGRCVVAGNVRRTALIALGDPDDKDYVEAKNYTLVSPIIDTSYGNYGWYTNKWGRMTQKLKSKSQVIKEQAQALSEKTGVDSNNPGIQVQATQVTEDMFDMFYKQNNHRWASNNSVYTTELFDDFHFVAAGMIANGEPGVVNEWLIKNYGRIKDGYQEGIDKDATGVNPCGEITLANAEPCNLAEVIPYMCYTQGIDVYQALRIATQYTYRITFAKYSWKAIQHVIEENRRIGVSLTGMQDYFLARYDQYAVTGFEDGDITKPFFNEDIVWELDDWYKFVKEINESHAKVLHSTPAIKLTTCKPSGTVAKIPGVSSGIHWHYSQYLIQRIRFHETDSNLKILRFCGYPVEKDAKAPNTWVVEFPVKSPNADNTSFECSGDIPLEVQFANQYLFAYAWADNAVSATLTFKPEEVDKIEPLLKAYSNKIKSTSLLPYAGHGYVQAPWEPITEEEYNRRVSEISMTIEDAYSHYTITELSEIMDSDCQGGSCPIR